MKFKDMPYQRPDLDTLLARYAQLTADAEKADAQGLLDVYAAHCELQVDYYTAWQLASIRHTCDTEDEFYNGEQDFFDENSPRVNNAVLALYQAILDNPARQVLAEKYAPILLEKMEVKVKSATPEILELMQQENALSTEYEKLYASARIPFDGKILSVAQLTPYKQSPDRAVRRAAFEAEGAFFDQNREKLDDIYDQLVKNRTQQARKMGYENYIPLGYIRMERLGYGQSEVESYRRQIVRDVVPLAAEAMARKLERIGVKDAKFYDLNLEFASGNPVPHGTPEEILAAGQEMYHQLSPETAGFIDLMMENGLFDVLSRPGKAPGGYCSDLPKWRCPFIFSNFNGTSGDVDVLTHEAGHAFAAYMAFNQGLPGELLYPGMESCEIHSMSMEFLTSPYHHAFFKQDTDKYALAHAEDALFFLPYGCMVDEFQHIVYANPDLTPAQRNEAWLELEKKYRPWVDMDDLPFYGRGAGWQRQLHIFGSPFYYIDYCLAQTVALQFFAAWLKNPADAWQRYLALVNKAGTLCYADLVRSAGMQVPFEEGSLVQVAREVADWIAAHQVS